MKILMKDLKKKKRLKEKILIIWNIKVNTKKKVEVSLEEPLLKVQKAMKMIQRMYRMKKGLNLEKMKMNSPDKIPSKALHKK